MANRRCLKRRTYQTCDRVLLINTGHFVISCNMAGTILSLREKLGANIGRKKKRFWG